MTDATNRLHVVVDGAFSTAPDQQRGRWTIFYDGASTVSDALELLLSAFRDLNPGLDFQPQNIRMLIFGRSEENMISSPEDCWFQVLPFIRLSSLSSLTQVSLSLDLFETVTCPAI